MPEHRVVGTRRGIERYLLFQRLPGFGNTRLISGYRQKRRAHNIHVLKPAPRPGGALLDRRHQHVTGIGEGSYRVRPQAGTQLATHFRVIGIYRRDIDGDFGTGDRARIKKRGHHRVPVMLALKVAGLAGILKRFEHGLQAQNVLPQARSGRAAPGGGVAAFDMPFYLGAQSELKTPAGQMLQVPGDLGRRHGAAGEGYRYVGTQADCRGVFRHDPQRQEGVMTGLRRVDYIEPHMLGPTSGGGNGAEALRVLPPARILAGLRTQNNAFHFQGHCTSCRLPVVKASSTFIIISASDQFWPSTPLFRTSVHSRRSEEFILSSRVCKFQ